MGFAVGPGLAEMDGLRWSVVLCASLLAAAWDLHTRRIPNVLTLPLLLAGLVCGGWNAGLSGLGDAVLGCVVLAAPYILLFVSVGGGAGDAKMMGGIGAWLGFTDGVVVLVAVAVAGAAGGLVKLIAHRKSPSGVKDVLAQLYVLCIVACSGHGDWDLVAGGAQPQNGGRSPGVPMAYGPAIFIGVCIGAVVVHIWQLH